jgi:sulfite reductase (NADPH) flavoprotein alpha-component
MQPIYVLYGTETYNSQDLAERTGDAIKALGLAVVVADMHDFDAALLPSLHTLLIVTSTYGAGEPPANAEAFYDHVHEDAPPLPDLRFSVCGLGDSGYPDFCQCAKDFDARLAALGAQRVVPRVDCDLDFEAPWQDWLDHVTGVLPSLGSGTQSTRNAVAEAPTAPMAAGGARLTEVHVLYGTETYNSQDLAERTGETLQAAGINAVVLGMEAFDLNALPRLHALLIITSTYGAGEPPANAEALYDHLMDGGVRLSGVHFSVCGLGDSGYPDFCQCGIEFDQALADLGATRIAARQDCDVDFEGPWQAWLSEAITALRALPAPQTSSPQTSSPPASAPPKKKAKKPAPLGSRKNPFFATVVDNHNLNPPGSGRETRHLALDLRGSGIEYRVGDALGLFARNDPELVHRILWATGLAGTEPVEVAGEWLYLRDALIYKLDVTWADAKLVTLAANHNGRGAHHFTALAKDSKARKAYLAEHHVIDVLAAAQMRLEATELVKHLRPLAPRLYSISSSPNAHPGEVHLTIGVVRYTMHGLDRKGIASCFVAERAVMGAQVPVYLQKSADFLLTDDDDAPIIMIGPGTGLAPFRAFLEEREHRGAQGYTWLFFGARTAADDFIYRKQVLDWQQRQIITRLDLAFSRDQAEKIYVQDRMWENGADLWAWIDAGSHIYVCGDAKRMAKDVHATLLRVISTYGERSAAEAEQMLKDMARSGHYLRDVY